MNYEWISILIEKYGYFGIFLVSALGNMIPYTTIPYLILVMAYASTLPTLHQQILTAIASATGAAIGKIMIYYIGRGARRIISEENKRKLRLFTRLAGKGIFITILLFAALPLPDDVIYVPVGIAGYSLVKYFIAVLLGKIIITLMAVYFGSSIRWLLEGGLGLPLWISLPTLVILTLWITFVILKMDWEKIVEDFSEEFTKGMKTLTSELLRALIPRKQG